MDTRRRTLKAVGSIAKAVGYQQTCLHPVTAWNEHAYERFLWQCILGLFLLQGATSTFGITSKGSTSYPATTDNEATPVRVQGNATGSWSSGSTFTITLGATPTNGNTLIAVISTWAFTSGKYGVSSISQTGVTWTGSGNGKQAYKIGASSYNEVEIWLGTVGSGASTTITVTLLDTGGSDLYAALGDVCEYSGLASASTVLDKTATNENTSTTTGDTGTTATTTQANELFIGGILGVITSASSATQSSPTNSFSLLDGNTHTSGDQTWSLGYLEKIVSATGTANSSVTFANSVGRYLGVIATFKAAPSEKGYTKLTQQQYADVSGGVISSFSFYVSNYTSGDEAVLCFYADSSGSPGALLWNSATAGTDPGGTGWWSPTYASGTAAAAGSWPGGVAGQLVHNDYYWFGWQVNSTDAIPGYAAGSANTGWYAPSTFGTLPGTNPSGTLTAENWTMYLTYSAAAAKTTTYNLGAALQKLGLTKTFGIDASFGTTFTKPYTVDLAAKAIATEAYGINLAELKALTKNYGIDAALEKLGLTKAYGIDAEFANRTIKTFGLDAGH